MILSAAMAAAAGGLYAIVLLIVTPQSMFGMLVSAQALVVALFGGVGTLWGPVIGSVILVPLAETLHAELGNIVPGIQGVVYGLAIIIIILLAPEGIYWRIRDRLAARRAGEPVRAGRARADDGGAVAVGAPRAAHRASRCSPSLASRARSAGSRRWTRSLSRSPKA